MKRPLHRLRSSGARGGLLAWLLIAATGLPAGASSTAEIRVEAAFLFNFAKFVEWPPDVLASARHFGICLLGTGADPDAMRELLKPRRVRGRRVRVHAISHPSDGVPCQLLFVSEAELSTREVVEALAGRSVLTVGDAPDFARSGGMVGFVRSDEKLRFVVNKRAVEEAGLTVSSHMLKVAQDVYE